jgi:hypothetical protein
MFYINFITVTSKVNYISGTYFNLTHTHYAYPMPSLNVWCHMVQHNLLKSLVLVFFECLAWKYSATAMYPGHYWRITCRFNLCSLLKNEMHSELNLCTKTVPMWRTLLFWVSSWNDTKKRNYNKKPFSKSKLIWTAYYQWITIHIMDALISEKMLSSP